MPAAVQLRAYFRHYFTAKRRGHGVHSPFVYELARAVFPAKPVDPRHAAEQWRNTCLSNQQLVSVTDFGTGASGPRTIASIARRAAKGPQQGALLGRLVHHLKPAYLLELGTSLGITTLYEAQPGQQQFVTLEGCAATATVAKTAFEKYNAHAEVVTGNFDETLQATLSRFPRLDYVYIDGNHRREPTLRYFEQCLPKLHNDAVVVFDDINWSADMEQAWREICAHPRVRVSIDLFHFGIVFFRGEQPKEHFVLFS